MLPNLSHGLQAEGIKPMFHYQGKTELECKQQKETGRVFVFLKLQNRLSPARHRRHADTRRHRGPPPCLSGALIRQNLLWGMTGECTRCCHYKSASSSAREGLEVLERSRGRGVDVQRCLSSRPSLLTRGGTCCKLHLTRASSTCSRARQARLPINIY